MTLDGALSRINIIRSQQAGQEIFLPSHIWHQSILYTTLPFQLLHFKTILLYSNNNHFLYLTIFFTNDDLIVNFETYHSKCRDHDEFRTIDFGFV